MKKAEYRRNEEVPNRQTKMWYSPGRRERGTSMRERVSWEDNTKMDLTET
jgi:hypothetical protein